MAYTYKVLLHEEDKEGKWRVRPESYNVQGDNPDLAKDKVRNLLKGKNLLVRSINFAPDKQIIVYVTRRRTEAKKLDGWQHRPAPRS